MTEFYEVPGSTSEEGLGNWSLTPATPAKPAGKVLQPRRGHSETAEDDDPSHPAVVLVEPEATRH
jgi:hypothetical protein